VVFHGDVDEIPTVEAVRYARPRGMVACAQKLYCFAVDWQHPDPWWGTVVTHLGNVTTWAGVRDARLKAPRLDAAGWHFSWLATSSEGRVEKMRSFCHPEIEDAWFPRLDECYETGLHVDGKRLLPVEVDDTYPRWIRGGNAPKEWYRP
jgi:hypothetical protein